MNEVCEVRKSLNLFKCESGAIRNEYCIKTVFANRLRLF